MEEEQLEQEEIPYEKLTFLNISELSSSVEELMADFDKLDLWSKRLDSEYPKDDINYNEGEPKQSHPFHKIVKYYSMNKDVFLLLAVLRNEKTRNIILRNISERSQSDPKIFEEFKKKVDNFLERAERGEHEADAFLDDPEVNAYFSGNYSEPLSHQRKRNIHENLYINVVKPNKVLKTSSYFNRSTPLMMDERSNLKNVQIYGNGKMFMSVAKGEGGIRNYTFNKNTNMHMEIGWHAEKEQGKRLFCVVILKIVRGKASIDEINVEGEEPKSIVSITELASQNNTVLVQNKNINELLNHLLIVRKEECTFEFNCVVQPSTSAMPPQQPRPKEKLTIVQLPKNIPCAEKKVLKDFKNLKFSKGPFSPDDEINFNDGNEASPFDKMARVYGLRKDVFLFNSMLLNPKKRQRVLGIAEEAVLSSDDAEDLVAQMGQFNTNMSNYVEKISSGIEDAKTVLDEGVMGYYSGFHVAKRGQPRNVHANLNINVTKDGQVFETSSMLQTITPRMMEEKSKLERIRIFGNGRRIMHIINEENGQRNYTFSKFATMHLDIEWPGKTKSGEPVTCFVTLVIDGGQITMKVATIDGVIVKVATIYSYAMDNKEVVIEGKSLYKVLQEVFYNKEKGHTLSIDSMKAKIHPVIGGVQRLPSSIFDCESEETLTLHLTDRVPCGDIADHPRMKGILLDFGKIKFTKGPFSSKDDLNYCNGENETPFNKIRKYYEKKDLFLFIAAILRPDLRATIWNIVEQGCGDDAGVMQEFEKNMLEYLDVTNRGQQKATQFLGMDNCRGLGTFFAGTEAPELYINVGVSGKSLAISEYFRRSLPQGFPDDADLETIKIYGDGRPIATVNRKDYKCRNYLYTKSTEMDLKVRWKAIEYGPTPFCSRERECMVILKTLKGLVTISKASLDGQTIQAVSILELAKQNDKVFFLTKPLYDIMHFSCVNAVVKGATTLFFTAASANGTGDATKLNNCCVDVFLMLMLQDAEERERILQMVSQRSPRPEATRREFLDRMEVFRERFANGEYINGGAGSTNNNPGSSRDINQDRNGGTNVSSSKNAKRRKNTSSSNGNSAERKSKAKVEGCKSGVLTATSSNQNKSVEATRSDVQSSTSSDTGGEEEAGQATEPAVVFNLSEVQVLEAGASGEQRVPPLYVYDDEDDDEDDDDGVEGQNSENGSTSLILLGADSYPIELLRNIDWQPVCIPRRNRRSRDSTDN